MEPSSGSMWGTTSTSTTTAASPDHLNHSSQHDSSSDHDLSGRSTPASSSAVHMNGSNGSGGGGGGGEKAGWGARTLGGVSSKRFWGKHLRKLSTSLPTYVNLQPQPVPGPKASRAAVARAYLINFLHALKVLAMRRPRATAMLLVGLIAFHILAPIVTHAYRANSHLGGGHRFVIILAANKGGGVTEWKNAQQWASERESIANKKHFVNKWGYHLEIKDTMTKKKYAHEWRESWEKVDIIKQTMRQYPKAEWFWWLDLHTYIMEHSLSLQSHIFNHLDKVTYRDINIYNPLNITHPPPVDEFPWLTPAERSPVGDGRPDSINLIVSQDCGGFNLGSFFIRRSEWSERLLDIWWDPVGYEQKHMEWEHKEQDALEYLYTHQPWIRTATAFIPQRMINSFPPGACAETPNDPRIFYNEKDRDFLVNMAGCEWGRDCWGEMATYKRLSKKLNRPFWRFWG